ncbi:S8 family serine peptidase [Cellulomonas gilvus]|uniref:Peptidase S8 and S53 subtilisin kexin sedolisin n=1 Tax=Cellulomonas gilvus (strain ATCC 13127 / NRRL B-14078) TaxID=593907 RepID=F7ZZ09_CELGA|nr:S8 family serine peptidase [Cellulomonas gilvus]AEI11277.1 peptidase S8 and S53 subtilisin kexin sedolisin [Cellulomonas gilvus ATCC 13127]
MTRPRTLLVGALASVLGASLAAPAQAATDTDDGLWYFTKTGMERLHREATGEGVRVAVIDTAIQTDVGDLVGTDLTVHEPSFCADEPLGTAMPAVTDSSDAAHGTTMTSLVIGTGEGVGIRGVAPDASVSFYSALTAPAGAPEGKCYPETTAYGGTVYAAAIDQAVADGADIISISLSTESPGDGDAIARALHAGVIVVAAVEPDGGRGYPAAHNGVVAVNSVGPDGKLWDGAPPGADVVAPGEGIRHITEDLRGAEEKNGSSSATAYTAAALALVWSAYPDATADQILQTLVRNTESEDHELFRDPEYGHGRVNVRHMLEKDPTRYPDENPLLDRRELSVPTYDEVQDPPPAPGASASPEPTPTPAAPATEPAPAVPSASATAAPAPSADDGAGVPVAALGAGGLLTAALAATAVVLVRRRSATPATASTHPSSAAPPDPRPHPGEE